MKKIIAASLALAGLMSSGAFAATAAVPRLDANLINGYLAVAPVGRQINVAQTGTLSALANRAGFVKNNFDFTVSANVVAGVQDDAANNRFGAIAASNKGYNVFTGSSVGGSITQCGTQVPNDTTATPNLAATEVVAASLVLANANGCGRN